LCLLEPESFADASLDAVAVDGRSGMLARDKDSQARPARRPPLEVELVTGVAAALTFA